MLQFSLWFNKYGNNTSAKHFIWVLKVSEHQFPTQLLRTTSFETCSEPVSMPQQNFLIITQ